MYRCALGLGLISLVAACAPSTPDRVAERAIAPVVDSADTERVATFTDRPRAIVLDSPERPAVDAFPRPSAIDAPTAEAPAVQRSVDAGTTRTDVRRSTPWTLEPYAGLGAWLDAFDWSTAFARDPEHTIGLDAVDHMAAEGVQTIYIQGSRWNAETDVLEPERLVAIIDRAHALGMSVVAWYLPTLEDLDFDLRRMTALAELDFDGFGVDIEARNVDDVGERNRRMLELSHRLDVALEGRPLAAIVLEPVIMEDVNPNYWPDYPWLGLAETYDVWLPMGYWTNRRGHWRDAYTYTATNIARVRERIGIPDAPVHAIGGIGDKTSVNDLRGMVTAAVEHGAMGGSIYDYRTSRSEHWEILRSFRAV